MERHKFHFSTKAEYKAREPFDEPHVALIDEDGSVCYDFVDNSVKYNLYDILWSDGKITPEIRPVSDGVVPIGLCVIPTNWLDEGEKARFVSLKYMSSSTSEEGTLNPETLYWGAYNPNPDPIADYYVEYAAKNESEDLADSTYAGMTWDLSQVITKDLRDQENWKYTYDYCKKEPGKYAVGDINGKQNTINISVEGNYYTNMKQDMKNCVAQYKTQGTNAGDWYIPAAGELFQFVFRLRSDQNNPSINDKLDEIAKIYPEHCVTSFGDDADSGYYYWSSSVMSSNNAYLCSANEEAVVLDYYGRNSNIYVVAYLLR